MQKAPIRSGAGSISCPWFPRGLASRWNQATLVDVIGASSSRAVHEGDEVIKEEGDRDAAENDGERIEAGTEHYYYQCSPVAPTTTPARLVGSKNFCEDQTWYLHTNLISDEFAS